MRQSGKVKWFNTSSGLGCITAEGGEEIAVRASAIVLDGLAGLEEGQAVEFDLARGPDGARAERVVPIEPVPE